MIYEPKNKTAEEVLELAGFTQNHNGARGWVRESFATRPRKEGDCVVLRATPTKKISGRLHALVRDGIIDIHFDVDVDGKHVTKRFNNNTKAARKNLEYYDLNV